MCLIFSLEREVLTSTAPRPHSSGICTSLGPNLRPRWRLPCSRHQRRRSHVLLRPFFAAALRDAITQTSFDSSGPPSAVSQVSTLTRRCEFISFYFFLPKLESSRPTRPCVAPSEILRFDRHQSRPRTRVRSKNAIHTETGMVLE